MEKKEKVVILGGGIAGLTAGIHLLQQGYEVTALEKNQDVGGLCYGQFIDGYYIDTCIHWLMGTNKKSSLYKEWKAIGALGKDTKILSLPTVGTYEYEGTTVNLYRNLEKTEKALIKISPEDKKAIHRFISASREMGSLMGILFKNQDFKIMELLKTLSGSAHIIRSMRQSRESYAEHFKHPALRFALKNAMTGYNNMFFFLDFYGLFSTGNADVPEGGAYYMVQRIKQRFLDLGGQLFTDTQVDELVVKKKEVVAAKTNKGEFHGDRFISSIDPQYTLKTLLGGKYEIPLFNRLDKTVEKRSISSCVNVYLAVDGDVSKIKAPTVLHTEPMKIGAKEVDTMLVRPYGYDAKHFVKDGKTVVLLFIDQNQDDYAYYDSLSEKDYKKAVKKVEEAMIGAFLKRYPEFDGKVERLYFFGPKEIAKATNTSYGSIQSYSFTDKGMFYIQNGRVPKLNNLYLAGQWIRAIGGTPTALLTGIEAAKNVIKDKPKEKDKPKKKRRLPFRKKKASKIVGSFR